MSNDVVDLTLEPIMEPAPHQDVSFDLETLGLKSDAMILAIGAVKFNRHTGELGEQFYRVIDITAPCGGGTISASTVVWWMNQSAEAREAVFSNNPAVAAARVDLRQALVEFSEFVGFNDELPDGKYPDTTMWQRGDKDGQWLEAAYEGMQLKLPYGFWQLDNQRTLTGLFKPFLPVRYGVAHNALDDAMYQAQCLATVFKRLNTVGAFASDARPDSRPATDGISGD